MDDRISRPIIRLLTPLAAVAVATASLAAAAAAAPPAHAALFGSGALSVGDVTVAEGDSGDTNARFTVTLAGAGPLDIVRVDYTTAPDEGAAHPASSPADYAGYQGRLVFGPGEKSKTVDIKVHGDTFGEPNETFRFVLSNPDNATIDQGAAVGTITNDDGPAPTFSVANAKVDEGDSVHPVGVRVDLDRRAPQDVWARFTTADGTATAGTHYTKTQGTVLVKAGRSSVIVAVPVKGDKIDNYGRTFFVRLSGPMNANLGRAQAKITIVDDEPDPRITIGNRTVVEGTSGTTGARFFVRLSTVAQKPITVRYATADGTAKAGLDYVARSGEILFSPGQSSRKVVVAVKGDTLAERDERFTVRLSDAVGAKIAIASGTGTITDDDGPPSITINDVSIPEGNSGTRPMTFTVRLSRSTHRTVTVQWGTASDTAKANEDYIPVVQGLTFKPGQTVQHVTVQVKGDTLREADERFFLKLFDPVNATIARVYGIGLIRNDD
jgi:hypothetical protein